MKEFSAELLADIARSGLTAEDAERLGYEDLTPADALKRGFGRRQSYVIPYFDLAGQKTEFYRVRFLDDDQKASNKVKPPKYKQPYGTSPRLYFPPGPDWQKYASNPKMPIVFTEGEKKAAIAAKNGMFCVALGGVWSFKSNKIGKFNLIDDFNLIEWKDRKIVIAFDSDVMVKAQVRAALHAFAREMTSRGAKPATVTLPDGPDGSKTGIDDYVMREGFDKFYHLVMKCPEPFDEIEEFWKFNEEYAVVVKPPSIYRFADNQLLRTNDFVHLVEADRRVPITDSKGKVTMQPAGAEWLKWDQRRKYKHYAYEPGEPREMDDGGLNLWLGWGADSVEGDISWWNYLLDHLFGDDKVNRDYFEKWCAYPIQYPGTKMFTAALLWGEQGAGKSIVGYILCEIYGSENSQVIEQKQLHNAFNQWAKHKQFILAEEVGNTDRRSDADQLKGMITRAEVSINVKFQPEYTIRDTVNYLFTSNNPDAAFLADDDRRFYIYRVYRVLDQTKGAAIMAWAKTEAGKAALRFHLEHLDLTGFDPNARAMMTEAKAEMIEAGRSDLDRWCHQLCVAPHVTVSAGASGSPKRDLWTLKELAASYEASNGKAPSLKALSNSLVRAHIPRTPTLDAKYGGVALWIIDNASEWLAKPLDEIGAKYAEAVKLPKF